MDHFAAGYETCVCAYLFGSSFPHAKNGGWTKWNLMSPVPGLRNDTVTEMTQVLTDISKVSFWMHWKGYPQVSDLFKIVMISLSHKRKNLVTRSPRMVR